MSGWPRYQYTITPRLINRLLAGYQERHRYFPSARSGIAFDNITWMSIDQAMRQGSHGWNKTWGTSLPDYKSRHELVNPPRPKKPRKSRAKAVTPREKPIPVPKVRKRRVNPTPERMLDAYLIGLSVRQACTQVGVPYYTGRGYYRQFRRGDKA